MDAEELWMQSFWKQITDQDQEDDQGPPDEALDRIEQPREDNNGTPEVEHPVVMTWSGRHSRPPERYNFSTICLVKVQMVLSLVNTANQSIIQGIIRDWLDNPA